MEQEYAKMTMLFSVIVTCSFPILFLANTGKAPIRQTKREGEKVAIIAVLAGGLTGRGGYGALFKDKIKAWVFLKF